MIHRSDFGGHFLDVCFLGSWILQFNKANVKVSGLEFMISILTLGLLVMLRGTLRHLVQELIQDPHG